MTVKPGSCEEILQALALVTLVWLSRVGALCHFHLWRCFLMICDVLTLFFVSNFCCTRHSLWSFLGVAFVHRFKYKKDSHLRNSLLFIVSNPPSHCSLKSSLAFYMDSTTMWKPLHFQKIALNSWYFHTQKKQFQHGITVLPSEGLEISLNWWCGLKIKTNFLLIRSIDRATQSVKSLFQKWFKDGCTQIIEDRSQIKWWMRWCAWGSAARMSRWTHRRARTHAHT